MDPEQTALPTGAESAAAGEQAQQTQAAAADPTDAGQQHQGQQDNPDGGDKPTGELVTLKERWLHRVEDADQVVANHVVRCGELERVQLPGGCLSAASSEGSETLHPPDAIERRARRTPKPARRFTRPTQAR